MISVILIWTYILITTVGLGLILLKLAERFLGLRNFGIMQVILAGLVGATVYAGYVSIFMGVGLVANILMIVLIILGCILLKIRINDVARLYKDLSKTRLIVSIVLALIMAYGASHGIMHYDTALYHAQAIHWIEDYGVVPGLGNLHCRLGYNSAAFPVTALYSMAFIGGRSYHVVSGFCALLLAWECMGIASNIRNKCITTSLFARFMGIYYLLMIYDEMVSPASDYYMVTLAFIFFIRLLDMLEVDEEISYARFALLAFLACMILTIKLSGGLLILIAIIPAIAYVRNKEWGRLIGSVITSVIIVIPYLIRNVIISGWLLYPSTALDVFKVDWKIPYDLASYDYKEIQVYGRGFTDVSRYEESILVWFADWFKMQSALDRLFVCVAIVGVGYFVVKCLYYGFTLALRKREHKVGLELFVEALIILCFIFWLTTSPLMRYGCLYVYLVDAIVWGRLIADLSRNKLVARGVWSVLALVLLYKGAMFGREVSAGATTQYLIKQQDYTNYEVNSYEVDGVTIYMPVEGDQTGYDAFPSSPWQMDITLRGSDLSEGFRFK